MKDTLITSRTSWHISLSSVLIFALSSMMACNAIPGTGGAPNSGASDPSGSQADDHPVLSDAALPDFSLFDVNAASARYDKAVSPRDYLGEVSAWYFGHAT